MEVCFAALNWKKQHFAYSPASVQGCQMVYFHTKDPNRVYFGGPLNG
jgi:hypothetical protein